MKCRLRARINDHELAQLSAHTHYKILDNEAHNEDEQIATWHMIPCITIQRHLLS